MEKKFEIPDFILITFELPQKMWGWTDKRKLMCINLFHTKNEAIQNARAYIKETYQ